MPSSHAPPKRYLRLLFAPVLASVLCWALLAPGAARAAAAPAATAVPDARPVAKPDPRAAIAKKLDVRVEDVRTSPIPGLYEVVSGTDVLYASPDGRFRKYRIIFFDGRPFLCHLAIGDRCRRPG